MNEIDTDEIAFSEFYLKYDEDLEHLIKLVLQNIAMNIAGMDKETTSLQEEPIPNYINSDVMQEIIMQGMVELEDEELLLIYLRYGLNIETNEISRIRGLASAEVDKQSIASKCKLEKILKGNTL